MNDLALIPSTTRATTPSVATRFDDASIGLHWATAILVAAMLASAWATGLARDGRTAAGLLTLHRSLGVTLWMLAIARLTWRLRYAARPRCRPACPLCSAGPPA
jgi:cytochrome b561